MAKNPTQSVVTPPQNPPRAPANTPLDNSNTSTVWVPTKDPSGNMPNLG
jgi:hypothetical protein